MVRLWCIPKIPQSTPCALLELTPIRRGSAINQAEVSDKTKPAPRLATFLVLIGIFGSRRFLCWYLTCRWFCGNISPLQGLGIRIDAEWKFFRGIHPRFRIDIYGRTCADDIPFLDWILICIGKRNIPKWAILFDRHGNNFDVN